MIFSRLRMGTPDPDAFMRQLQAAHPGGRAYSKVDRYRDFRQVFLETEQGRRVLYEILLWSHMFHPSAPAAKFDPYEAMFLDGERSLGQKIMRTMNAEPVEQPQSSKEMKHG